MNETKKPRGAMQGRPDAPEEFLSRRQEEMAKLADDVIVSAYEQLRDESVAAGDGGLSYPNIRRLYGSTLEREKDRREVRAGLEASARAEMQAWYEEARAQPCTWWIQNHLVARLSLKGCITCGVCASLCPASEYYEEYNPRVIVDAALSGEEEQIVGLLTSETLWYCGQCGSCKPQCPRENNIMGLVSSLRFLAQLKGYHLRSLRGRQQYAARHLWGGNLWNRGSSLYFRNVDPARHPDFGPRHAAYHREVDFQMARVGAHPDRTGLFGGRKLSARTIEELRRCVAWGGSLVLWNQLEEHAAADARAMDLPIDDYHDRVGSEG